MPESHLNHEQIIREVYALAANALRVTGNLAISDGSNQATITDVAGKKSLDVNVTSLTLSSSDDSVETRSQPMKTAIDEASSTVTYIGEATTGTTTSSSNWRIKRLTQSGSVLIIEWADGNGNFDNIWDNRTSLTYS